MDVLMCYLCSFDTDRFVNTSFSFFIMKHSDVVIKCSKLSQPSWKAFHSLTPVKYVITDGIRLFGLVVYHLSVLSDSRRKCSDH